jgi:hypothetical protein
MKHLISSTRSGLRRMHQERRCCPICLDPIQGLDSYLL